jgi:threonine/homoserine/homoserine lactone efflux protein
MAPQVWLSFAVATIFLVTMPGPTILLTVSYALGQGKNTAWATVPGAIVGDFIAMTISLMGAGAVLAASATLFTGLKLIGAGYLIWMGIQMWRSKPMEINTQKVKNVTHRKIFKNTFLVTVLNPKGIVFFVAFVPQFVDPAKDTFIQFAILEATFIFLAATSVLMWALLASVMHSKFKEERTQNIVNKLSGSFLIGAGFLTLAAKRSS